MYFEEKIHLGSCESKIFFAVLICVCHLDIFEFLKIHQVFDICRSKNALSPLAFETSLSLSLKYEEASTMLTKFHYETNFPKRLKVIHTVIKSLQK